MDELLLAKDLVSIFVTIYNGDVANNDKKVKLRIPVQKENLDIWNSLKNDIVELVEFVTEFDYREWYIEFNGVSQVSIKQIENLKKSKKESLNCVSLISGGLDSYCGAYYNEINNYKSIYMGYKISNIDTSYINAVGEVIFGDKSNNEDAFIVIDKVHVNKVKTTQRTRSLLFFALATYVAVSNKIDNVNVYENGTMTLNPSFQIRGTTKTTHPRTIFMFQRILNELNFSVELKHPFLFKTKGEVVRLLDEEKYLNNIKKTRSCSKSNQVIGIKGYNSCGVCVPCILRKISIASCDMEKYDHDYLIPYNGSFTNVIREDKIANFKDEYNSSIRYFKIFNDEIKNGTILNKIDIRQKYYGNNRKLEKDVFKETEQMLQRFSKEIDIFFNRYL